jgi:quercetin dioxygenase-like cupin family protein
MFTKARGLVGCATLAVAALALVLLIRSPGDAAAGEAKSSGGVRAAQGPAMGSLVRQFARAEKVEYPWGWIRWLVNSETDPDAEMTFGIVYVKANQRNPMHVHPNCAEYLHVLSGSCEHLVGKKWLKLKAGDTVRIPVDVPHMARTLDEPMRAVIVYNTGKRQFVPVEEGKEE